MVEKTYKYLKKNKKVFFSFTLYPEHRSVGRVPGNLVLRPSDPIKIFPRFPFAAEFANHCVLKGGTQRRALHHYQGEEM